MDKKKKSQTNSTHDHPGSRQDPALEKLLQLLTEKHIRYLDLIPRASLEEKIVHLVLEGYGPWSEMGPVFDQLLEAIKQYHTNELRTVVFGGGSGLSGILGGDTALSTWHQAPFDGLKRMFSRLTVAVCITDDGGSSGKLLRDLGCIAVGDLRRAILSSITPRGLLNRYSSLNLEQLESVADALQHILNYRFSRTPNRYFLKAPSTVISQKLRRSVPDSLLEYLDKTGAAFLEDPMLKDIRLEEQCLGNLLLVSLIYSQRKGGKQKDTTRRFTPTGSACSSTAMRHSPLRACFSACFMHGT